MPLGVREMLSELVLSKLFGLFNSILVGAHLLHKHGNITNMPFITNKFEQDFISCTVSYTTALSIFASWFVYSWEVRFDFTIFSFTYRVYASLFQLMKILNFPNPSLKAIAIRDNIG